MASTQGVVKKERISTTETVGLVAFALICDVLSFIPVANIIIAMIAPIIFGLAFYLNGISLISPKKAMTAGLSLIVEMVPVLSSLPAYTAGVLVIIYLTNVEDKTGVNLTGKLSAKAKMNNASAKFEAKNPSNTLVKNTKENETQTGRKSAYNSATYNNDENLQSEVSGDGLNKKNKNDYSAQENNQNITKKNETPKRNFADNLKMADEYDRKSVELMLAGRTDEAEEYRQASSKLRREHVEEVTKEETHKKGQWAL